MNLLFLSPLGTYRRLLRRFGHLCVSKLEARRHCALTDHGRQALGEVPWARFSARRHASFVCVDFTRDPVLTGAPMFGVKRLFLGAGLLTAR